MKLIDADKLILHLNDYALTEAPDERENAGERRISRMVYSAIQNCMKAVEEQPTAFDINNVVEQLESEMKKAKDEVDYGKGLFIKEPFTPYMKAIEIVKGGGINADSKGKS